MLAFPAALRPTAGGYAQNPKTLSGGQSLSGLEQIASTMSDRWQASFKFPFNRGDRILALRAFIIGMGGRLNAVALPTFSLRAPWPVVRGIAQTPKVKRDRALDGTPFADPANFNDTLIRAALADDASAMDVSVSVAMTLGSAPLPGHLFSLGTRLYAIISVTGSGPYDCGIWPPLRLDAAAGLNVNFTSPTCEMRFASDAEGADALKTLDQFKFGVVTFNFDEASVTS